VATPAGFVIRTAPTVTGVELPATETVATSLGQLCAPE
jgi:hypothetical protein